MVIFIDINNGKVKYNDLLIDCIILGKRLHKNQYILSQGSVTNIFQMQRYIEDANNWIEDITYHSQKIIDSYQSKNNKLFNKDQAYQILKIKGETLKNYLKIPLYDLTVKQDGEECCLQCHNQFESYLDGFFNFEQYWLINREELRRYNYKKYINCNFNTLDKYINEKNNIIRNSIHLCSQCRRKLVRELMDQIFNSCSSYHIENENKRKNIPAKLRIKLLNESARWVEKEHKYIPSCAFCGATANETSLHIDHIIPVSKGGKTEEDNLQVLCEKCNEQKNNRYELVINK